MSSIEVCIGLNGFLVLIHFVLVRRGIPAQPILNGYCGNYELGMPRSMINYPAFNYEYPIWNNWTTTTAVTSIEQASAEFSSILWGAFNDKVGYTSFTIFFLFFVFFFLLLKMKKSEFSIQKYN